MTDSDSERIPLGESERGGLGKRAALSSFWTLIGFGSQQVIRMATHLFITYFLLPEAVGLMALVSVWAQGIALFTDIGIGANIMQHKRGGSVTFLRTAWTIQTIRGFVIFVFVAAAAWPLSRVYGQSALMFLLPVVATEAIFSGFATTSLFLANRRLQLARITVMEVTGDVVAGAVAIAWASIQPSVWAYVSLPITRAIVRLTLSHFFFAEPRMRFQWRRDDRIAIIKFGKWIFLSSILGFFSSSLSLILVGFMPAATLAAYWIAFLWSRTTVRALYSISAKVLLPLYAHLADSDPALLAPRILRVRSALLLATLPIIYFFALFGEDFIALVYKDVYVEAGWMLKILACGAAISALLATTSSVLLAVGDSFRFMLLLATGTISMAVSMAVGWFFFGFEGLIVGVAVAEVFNYPVMAVFTHRYGVWLPKLDITVFGLTAFVTWLSFWVL